MSFDSSDQIWLPIIARSLARLAMASAQMDAKSISDRAAFLRTLGLDKNEIATMLGSTPASVAELIRQRNKKAGVDGESEASSPSKGKRK